MRHFCTLTDRNYLEKLLALYASLGEQSSQPHTLWVLAMDRDTRLILEDLDLEGVKVLPLEVFEADMNLKGVAESRALIEYFWTCASQLCEYLLTAYRLPMVTYLDADLYFFSDPEIVFNEIGNRSIAIIPHRFAEKDRARLEPNGLFNVGWVTFRNDGPGNACLSQWAKQCRERCSAKIGCGDQKYLDTWPEQFGDALCVIQNIGACAAPWNLQQYQVKRDYRTWDIVLDGTPLVFLHAHEYVNENDLTRWPLRDIDKALIYRPYIEKLRVAATVISLAQVRMAARSEQLEEEWQRA